MQKIAPKKLGHVTITDYTAILDGFKGVVNTPKGTAYRTFHQDIDFTMQGYPLAGKTGTADVTAQTIEEPNSWFVGFGPTNTTHQYVVVCTVNQGGYGDAPGGTRRGPGVQLPVPQPRHHNSGHAHARGPGVHNPARHRPGAAARQRRVAPQAPAAERNCLGPATDEGRVQPVIATAAV